MVFVFLVILNRLDAQERQTQNNRQHQGNDLRPALADLRAVNGHRHRKTAEDQHGGVDGAECDVEVIAGNGESFREFRTIERVGEKHPAEEHDFGDQEHPHAERSGLTLLLHVLKMVLQRGMAVLRVPA